MVESPHSAWRKQPARPTEQVSLLDEMRTTIDEARVVLPGIQALFGFQLMVVFNQSFDELQELDRLVHLVALLLVAVAVALVMAPAAYHRIAERGQVSLHFVDLASGLIAGALVPLMLGISLDVYVVAGFVAGSTIVGVAVGIAMLLLFAGLWFVLPWRHRLRRE